MRVGSGRESVNVEGTAVVEGEWVCFVRVRGIMAVVTL